MKIHYIENAWGHFMPIYFDTCCEPMTRLFSPETKPHTGFWFDNSDAELKEYRSGKIIGTVTRCTYCRTDIEMVKRELKE
jgi:hypothetical protein